MGEHKVNKIQTHERAAFIRQLLDDVKALEIMLKKELFEKGITRIGAEQEFCLVNDDFRPSYQSEPILEDINDPHFTTELARYNLEINLDPIELKGDCFAQVHQQLDSLLSKAQQSAQKFDNKVLLTGILPTITKHELEFDYMTPNPRYWALNDMMRQVRGSDFQLHIKGVDELSIIHDSVLFEACCTSFQLHLQIDPSDFVASYNWAQAISGPILSMATNSPLLLGKELWSESRIALFQQSIDTRSTSFALNTKEPRVAFGMDWSEGSPADIFKNDIARHTILLSSQLEEDSLAMLEKGEIPKLRALNLHNGTIYRWNRACYGVGGGKPHLRIENRYIPSGPSTVDEMANFVFWVGLMANRPKAFNDMKTVMDFRDAKDNFIKAARRGKSTELIWNGSSLPASQLVIQKLLPIAYQGLEKLNIDTNNIEYYLSIIEQRANGTTASSWLIENYRNIKKKHNQDYALLAVSCSSYENQQTGTPVHQWPAAPSDQKTAVPKLVRHIMQTELFTVNENDLADLATKVMQWKNIHHIPVENNKGELAGLLTWTHIQAYQNSENKDAIVKDIMVATPITVTSDDNLVDAIEIMKEKEIGCLPVVLGQQLIGIITKNDIAKF